MEMIRDTLYGNAELMKAKLEELSKHEDKAMRSVEERAIERIAEAEYNSGNRHERRKQAAIERKTRELEVALKG